MKKIFVLLVTFISLYGFDFIGFTNITYISASEKVIHVNDIDKVPECPSGTKRKILSQSPPTLLFLGPMFINYSECISNVEAS